VTTWNAARAADAFALPGRVLSIEPYGSGHINDSYLVTSEGSGPRARVLMQRVNHAIFRDPFALMANVERVTAHLAGKLAGVPDARRRALRLVPLAAGGSCHSNGDGAFWRAYEFIDGARSHDVVRSPAQAREAARAFARFSRLLSDLPAPRLSVTIPHFHDTRRRFQALAEAIERDPLGRAAAARETIDGYLRREPLADVLAAALADGLLTEGIAHNDTKLNNVLLDDATGEGVCVIDLDTVMPGLFLHDFGDLVRTAATSAAEDEPDTSKVQVDPELFEALVRGAGEGRDGELTPFERQSLALSGRVITFETGSRFLTDHLLGDRYFKVHRDGHNLDRARAQLALLASLEERDEELRAAAERALTG